MRENDFLLSCKFTKCYFLKVQASCRPGEEENDQGAHAGHPGQEAKDVKLPGMEGPTGMQKNTFIAFIRQNTYFPHFRSSTSDTPRSSSASQ